ncbi:MAG: type VI secretion system-associated FHA domain protein TagH [Desulfarculales bacterium]|jgi:type VI secretion system protein ImpI|nr:type VI secretion system-associated FHA domain protein TagH [Desulfarculales bacterium]
MELMLEVISRQKFSGDFPVSHVFGNVGGYIGRSRECEWVIPDKTKRMSRKHALISCDGSHFYIEDVSANGIFSPDEEKIGKTGRHRLEHGESFTLADYTIQARLLHDPKTYVTGKAGGGDIIPDDAFLDLDPLVAMEQQEYHEAKERLGYNELLSDTVNPLNSVSDHSDPVLDAMLPITAVVDTAATRNVENINLNVPDVAIASATGNMNLKGEDDHKDNMREVMPSTEIDIFFKALGFAQPPESPKERVRILQSAAQLLVASIDGILQSLQNRAESKNELRLSVTTMRLAGNNPLKLSPNPQAAIEQMLISPQSGMLPAVKAMYAAFEDIHSHHMGILAGARAAVNACLEKISPQNVVNRLDINGPVRIGRTARLWKTFIRMHYDASQDHEGFAEIFLRDFARAYEMQVHTLNPMPQRYSKGNN